MILALAFGAHGVAIAAPAESAAPGCDGAPVRIAVVEDEAGTLPSVAETYRQLKLASLGSLTRRAVEAHACLELWDPGAPGGPPGPPTLVARVKPERIVLRERSLAAKAESAVTRYIGSYLGGSSEEFPVIERIQVKLTLHCPGRKGTRADIVATDDAAPAQPDTRDPQPPIDANADRVIRAVAQAVEDAAAELRGKDLCAPAAG